MTDYGPRDSRPFGGRQSVPAQGYPSPPQQPGHPSPPQPAVGYSSPPQTIPAAPFGSPSSPAAQPVQPIGTPQLSTATPGAGPVRLGKTRGPFLVWLLSLITGGVYGLVWYYKVNRELRDYNGQITVSPGLALCNVTVIGMVTATISAIVSFCRTGGRIDTAMRYASAGRCSATAGFLLMLLLGFGVSYYQARLNRVWAAHGQA